MGSVSKKNLPPQLRRALDQQVPGVRSNKLFGQAAQPNPKKPPKPRDATVVLRERVFYDDLAKLEIPLPVREFYFHPERKWRFDYCWPEQGVALEVEGGVSKFFKSRHTQADGYKEDCVKYNAATVRGWRVLRCGWAELTQATMLADIQLLLSRPSLIVHV